MVLFISVHELLQDERKRSRITVHFLVILLALLVSEKKCEWSI